MAAYTFTFFKKGTDSEISTSDATAHRCATKKPAIGFAVAQVCCNEPVILTACYIICLREACAAMAEVDLLSPLYMPAMHTKVAPELLSSVSSLLLCMPPSFCGRVLDIADNRKVLAVYK
jgi:hypothetical protein